MLIEIGVILFLIMVLLILLLFIWLSMGVLHGAYHGAPMVSTKKIVVDRVLEQVDWQDGDLVLDIGCGSGSFLVNILKNKYEVRGLGIDISLIFLIIARLRGIFYGVTDRLALKRMSLFNIAELKEKDEVKVIVLYLLPELLQKLRPLLIDNFREDTMVISHGFSILNDDEFKVSLGDSGRIFVYRVSDLKI